MWWAMVIVTGVVLATIVVWVLWLAARDALWIREGRAFEDGYREGERVGRDDLGGLYRHLGPLTVYEYGLLCDGVRAVEANRLKVMGMTPEDVAQVEDVVDDFFAFEAAAEGPRREHASGALAHRVGRA